MVTSVSAHQQVHVWTRRVQPKPSVGEDRLHASWQRHQRHFALHRDARRQPHRRGPYPVHCVYRHTTAGEAHRPVETHASAQPQTRNPQRQVARLRLDEGRIAAQDVHTATQRSAEQAAQVRPTLPGGQADARGQLD